MKTAPHPLLLALALLGIFLGPAARAENETLDKFRASFESRLNAELDEQGEKARNLRKGYLEALNRLKGELGREEKLKAATQVLAEIEAVEDGEKATELPSDADYRFKSIRQKWDDGLEEIMRERNQKTATTAKIYLKALDDEKRKLTRAGKIKEALAFEEEVERVKALPEIKAVVAAAPASGKIVAGDVALSSRGARVRGASDSLKMIDGDNLGDPSTFHDGKFAHARLPAEFVVELGDLYQLNRIRFRLYDQDRRIYKFRVSVSATGTEWTVIDDKSETGAVGWQNLAFETQDIRFIKVEGFHNSVNDRFHIIELEAYCPEK